MANHRDETRAELEAMVDAAEEVIPQANIKIDALTLANQIEATKVNTWRAAFIILAKAQASAHSPDPSSY